MNIDGSTRVTVKQAAELLGVSEQFIRIGLQQGKLPIGKAVKSSNRCTYLIYKQRIERITDGKQS